MVTYSTLLYNPTFSSEITSLQTCLIKYHILTCDKILFSLCHKDCKFYQHYNNYNPTFSSEITSLQTCHFGWFQRPLNHFDNSSNTFIICFTLIFPLESISFKGEEWRHCDMPIFYKTKYKPRMAHDHLDLAYISMNSCLRDPFPWNQHFHKAWNIQVKKSIIYSPLDLFLKWLCTIFHNMLVSMTLWKTKGNIAIILLLNKYYIPHLNFNTIYQYFY